MTRSPLRCLCCLLFIALAGGAASGGDESRAANPWNVFAARTYADPTAAAPIANVTPPAARLDWQVFGAGPTVAPLHAAASAESAAWNVFATDQGPRTKDQRPWVFCYCPRGGWCGICLRLKHDPSVPVSEWIDTDSLPFRIDFQEVPDERFAAYPVFHYRASNGNWRYQFNGDLPAVVARWELDTGRRQTASNP